MRWLLELFAGPAHVEAILGDLHEEAAQVASTRGIAAARRWQVRQVVRTVAHLAVAPFKEAPVTVVLLGIVAVALTFPLSWGTAWLAAQVIDHVDVNVYEYVPAKLYWQAASSMSPFLLGFFIARVMPQRAMSTAVSAFFVLTIIVSVIDPFVLVVVLSPRPYQTLSFFITRAITLLLTWGLSLVAGATIGTRLMLRRRVA